MIVETNEKYEHVEKCNKRQLRNDKKNADRRFFGIEEEYEKVKNVLENQELLINNYNELEYHELYEDILSFEKKKLKEELTEEEELEYKDMKRKI